MLNHLHSVTDPFFQANAALYLSSPNRRLQLIYSLSGQTTIPASEKTQRDG